MPEPISANAGDETPLAGFPDLPLIIEQLQNQLDDLRAAVEAQQTQLERQAARLTALEHR
jgi:hypothetical protein